MIKKLFFAGLILLIFNSCTSKAEKLQTQKEIKAHQSAQNFYNLLVEQKRNHNKKLDDYIASMPLEEKIAQMFIENLEGCTEFRSYESYSTITNRKCDELKPLIAGGYLFFSFNLAKTPVEQKNFMDSIKNYTNKNNQIQPFLAIDQEGGFVNRLRKLTGGLPSQEKVSDLEYKDAYNLYKNQAYLMREELGFHMNLAPVLEVCTQNNREFLDGRSFGNLENTINYGKVCVNAYELQNIGTVVKHFPGNTNTDPHTGLPEIKDDLETIQKAIEGFKSVIQANPTGVQPAGVLMSHAVTSAVDPGVPACLSKIWVTDILRNQWGYEGIIFSDDIFMGALTKNGYPPEIAAVMSVEAGVNCIMTSEKRFGKQAKVLYDRALADKSFEEKINYSVKKILEYKIKANLFVLD